VSSSINCGLPTPPIRKVLVIESAVHILSRTVFASSTSEGNIRCDAWRKELSPFFKIKDIRPLES
jgi:hypothetical protein